MLCMNVGIKSASASTFGPVLLGDIIVGPYLLSDKLTAQQYFLETVLLGLLEGVPPAEAEVVVSARWSSSTLRKMCGCG